MAITDLDLDVDLVEEPDPTRRLRQAPTVPDEVATAVEITRRRAATYNGLLHGYDLPDLATVLFANRPAWMADALCREHPEINFYPDVGEATAPAKRICAQCLVRDECRAYADETGDRHGVWGGASVRERRAGAPWTPPAPASAKPRRQAKPRRRRSAATPRAEVVLEHGALGHVSPRVPM